MHAAKHHRVSARRHIPHQEAKGLPRGVRFLAWARAARWVGWGFGESLIPIFLFAFSASYAEAGLFSSVYEIALLLALPVIGMLADRTSAKVLVVVGLFLYLIVGASYFAAGATGLAFFIVIARAVNGVAWGLDSTGTDTYYRRVTDRNHLASSFGYIEMLGYGGWIAAALLGMLAAPYVPTHALLLMVAPFALLALPFVLLAPPDRPREAKRIRAIDSYRNTLKEWGTWDTRLRLLAVLVLFMGILDTLVSLFIPIDAFVEGADMRFVILLAVVATLPRLFGYLIGKFVDKHEKYRLVAHTLFAVALVMAALAFFPTYAMKLIASFLLGLLMEVFSLVGKSLVTTLGSEETYGTRGSAFESIATIGNLAAPLLIGISFDAFGFGNLALTLAFGALMLAAAFSLIGKRARRHAS